MALYDQRFNGYRVFAGDLGRLITRSDVIREFGAFGPLVDIWVARNPPGYAFLVYKHAEDAVRSVRELHGNMVCGRRVRVEHARPFDDRGPRSRLDPLERPVLLRTAEPLARNSRHALTRHRGALPSERSLSQHNSCPAPQVLSQPLQRNRSRGPARSPLRRDRSPVRGTRSSARHSPERRGRSPVRLDRSVGSPVKLSKVLVRHDEVSARSNCPSETRDLSQHRHDLRLDRLPTRQDMSLQTQSNPNRSLIRGDRSVGEESQYGKLCDDHTESVAKCDRLSVVSSASLAEHSILLAKRGWALARRDSARGSGSPVEHSDSTSQHSDSSPEYSGLSPDYCGSSSERYGLSSEKEKLPDEVGRSLARHHGGSSCKPSSDLSQSCFEIHPLPVENGKLPAKPWEKSMILHERSTGTTHIHTATVPLRKDVALSPLVFADKGHAFENCGGSSASSRRSGSDSPSSESSDSASPSSRSGSVSVDEEFQVLEESERTAVMPSEKFGICHSSNDSFSSSIAL